MQYWKSELGEKAYKSIERAYPTHPFDEAYSIFLPFTKERAEEMHKLCKDKITATANSIRTQYLVQKYNEYKISVDSFKSWKEGDFEVLYQYGNAEGVEKPVVRPKTKKSKEKEQSDFQKEILRKNYTTTTIKPTKENEENNYEERIEQGTVVSSTAKS